MKSIITKKQFYDSPVTHIKAGAVNTNVLAGSEHISGLEQQGRESLKEENPQANPTVGRGDVLAKPHSFFWEMSEDE